MQPYVCQTRVAGSVRNWNNLDVLILMVRSMSARNTIIHRVEQAQALVPERPRRRSRPWHFLGRWPFASHLPSECFFICIHNNTHSLVSTYWAQSLQSHFSTALDIPWQPFEEVLLLFTFYKQGNLSVRSLSNLPNVSQGQESNSDLPVSYYLLPHA